uniref:atypical chemokine receptor 3-like n=1 Tax=Myxine glutinosa TaxID=7769 RepID=UPI00358E7416
MSNLDVAPVLKSMNSQNLSTAAVGSSCNATDLICLWEGILLCVGPLDQYPIFPAIATMNSLIFVAGVLGNTLVLYVQLYTQRSARPEVHLYVCNLAVADLCVILTLPFWTFSLLDHDVWRLGDLLCKLTHTAYSANLYASIFFIVAISVDRYVSLVRWPDPLGRRRDERVHARRLACTMVWILALLGSVPDMLFISSELVPLDNHTICVATYPLETFPSWMAGTQLSLNLVGFALPCIAITLCHVLVHRALVRSHAPNHARHLVLAYTLVFLTCWFPYHCVLFLDALVLLEVVPAHCMFERVLFGALHVAQCFSLVHCCANPMLYTLLGQAVTSEDNSFLHAFLMRFRAPPVRRESTCPLGAERLSSGIEFTEIFSVTS